MPGASCVYLLMRETTAAKSSWYRPEAIPSTHSTPVILSPGVGKRKGSGPVLGPVSRGIGTGLGEDPSLTHPLPPPLKLHTRVLRTKFECLAGTSRALHNLALPLLQHALWLIPQGSAQRHLLREACLDHHRNGPIPSSTLILFLIKFVLRYDRHTKSCSYLFIIHTLMSLTGSAHYHKRDRRL